MPVNLVYIAQSGNHTYWTTQNGFSRKQVPRREWATSAELATAIPKLRATFPTIFKNRNDSRLGAFDVISQEVTPLNISTNQSSIKITAPLIQPYACPIKLTDKKRFAIAIDTSDGRWYYNSGKKGSLVKKFDQTVKRWSDQRKAEITAANLRNNDKFWGNYSDFNSEASFVINLTTGLPVWPRDADLPAEEKAERVINSDLIRIILKQLTDQLTDHFDPAINNFPSNDQVNSEKELKVDFAEYNAPRVFDAIAYLAMALTHKKTVDQLLHRYDGIILQDYLHVVEAADLAKFDSAAFAKSLQVTRLKRRQVKDLDIMLCALAEAFDPEKLLKSLWNNSSLRNQYHFRSAELGDELVKMLK